MPKRHFLGGLFSSKCRKKCRNGISYEKNEHSQNWKNCKKCRFVISHDLVHKKLKKLLKVCKYIFFNSTKLFHRDFKHFSKTKKRDFFIINLLVIFTSKT